MSETIEEMRLKRTKIMMEIIFMHINLIGIKKDIDELKSGRLEKQIMQLEIRVELDEIRKKIRKIVKEMNRIQSDDND